MPRQSRINHDPLFKELIQLFFVDFVEAFLPGAADYLDRDSVRFLDKELFSSPGQGGHHEVDLLARCKFKNEPACFLIHIEHQAQKQKAFGRRMFHYFARLYQRHELPVYPVVLFSHSSPVPEPDVFTVEMPDLKVLEFRYRVIQLSRLSWRKFMRHKRPVVCALMTRMGVRQEDRLRVRFECLRMLLTLKVDPAKQYFLAAFIDNYLRLNEEETLRFNQTMPKLLPQAEQERFMKLTTSWEERGLRKGLQKGRQEGRQEGLQKGQLIELRLGLIDILEIRFGKVPAKLRGQINQVDDAEILRRARRTATTCRDLSKFPEALPITRSS